MFKIKGSSLLVILILFLSASMTPVCPVAAQQAGPPEQDSGSSFQYHGYEFVAGITARAQALLVFDGHSDKKLAVMTGEFVPSPQIFVNTPFHPFSFEEVPGETVGRTGYYWKFSYNRFFLKHQEDLDTGGIGNSSPVYNYGTSVKGAFLAVAPVIAYERLKPDGSVPFRVEFGLGLGYLDLGGDIVLGDWEGDPQAPKTDIDYSGVSYFLFAMGRHQWGSLMFGYQMGISATSSKPYSYSQSFISLDFGYKIIL